MKKIKRVGKYIESTEPEHGDVTYIDVLKADTIVLEERREKQTNIIFNFSNEDNYLSIFCDSPLEEVQAMIKGIQNKTKQTDYSMY